MGGQVRASHHRNVCKILGLCGAISLLSLDVSPLNLIKLPYFKPFFLAVSMDIRLLLFIKIKKKTWKSYSILSNTLSSRKLVAMIFFLGGGGGSCSQVNEKQK